MKKNSLSKLILLSLGLSYSVSGFSATVQNGVRLFQKLAGVLPTSDQMTQITVLAQNDDLNSIADMAMAQSSFLSGTVKAFASPMSNVSQQAAVDLNDFSATIIGAVRDNVQMDRLLWDDILYVGDTNYLASLNPPVTVNPYSQYNDYHYRDLEIKGVDLSNPQEFVQVAQSSVSDPRGTPLLPDATMGLMTTNAAGAAFMSAGTNRRMMRYMFIDFMCLDYQNIMDTSRSDYRVRQDVPRNAGGDAVTYLNTCKGCHAGGDGLAGAFAYYEWKDFVTDNAMDKAFKVFKDTVVQNKMYHNVQVYPGAPSISSMVQQGSSTTPCAAGDACSPGNLPTIGYLTTDDSWVNLWSAGPNAILGWREPSAVSSAPNYVPASPPGYVDLTHGNGQKAVGVAIASSVQFSRCMAQRAYSQVCNRTAPYTKDETALFQQLGASFDQNGRLGKPLFKEAAIACINMQ